MKKIALYGLLFVVVCSTRSVAQSSYRLPVVMKEKMMHPPPIPYFFITGLCYGDTTHFFNKTTGTTNVHWSILNDKGDTLHQSNDADIAYYFRKRGFYSVCLTADNGHLATKTRVVSVDTIVNADFAYRNCFNDFENLSTCADHYVWILPDATYSTDTLPAYTFKAPGTFLTRLTAFGKPGKNHTANKFISIGGDSLGQPNPVFTFTHIDSTLFEFKAVDSLEHNYTWYFGDDAYDDTSGYKTRHVIELEKYNGSVELFLTNLCGFASFELNPFAITDVKETNLLNMNTSIYPNPASDEVTISVTDLPPSKAIAVKLIDAKGATVKETHILSNSKTVQLRYITSALPKGIYLVQIMAGEHLLSKKIVLQ